MNDTNSIDPPAPTVYVVDDDVSFLRSVSRLLRASGFQVVIHNSPVELLAELGPDSCGCVITDLMMPEMDGMALQQALLDLENPLPVVFLTGQGDIPTSVSAMRNGAEDFLTKQAPKENLIAAVRLALDHNVQHRAEQARLQLLRQRFVSLSARESEVLKEVLQGKLNKQIAAGLGIHERTVKLHRTHITTKLGVHSVAEISRLVQQAGMFQ